MRIFMCSVGPEKAGSVSTNKNAEIISFQPEKAIVRYISSNRLDSVSYDRIRLIDIEHVEAPQ